MEKKPKISETSVKRALQHPKTNQELRQKLGIKEKADPRLDRTLQKMRREGTIRADKGRWFLTSAEICSTCGGKGWVDGSKSK